MWTQALRGINYRLKMTQYISSLLCVFTAELEQQPEVNMTTRLLNGTREVMLTWKVSQRWENDTNTVSLVGLDQRNTYLDIILLTLSHIQQHCHNFFLAIGSYHS